MSIVVIAICIAGIVYIMFIRPRLRQRKAISDTREWLKGIGVPITDKPEPIDVTHLPNGSRVITDIRKHWGYPPKQDDVLEEIYSGEQVAGGWDYAVHIHEAAEQYLGTNQFLGLEKRFASVHGVDACKHVDREVFLIRTRCLDKGGVRDALWSEFLEAALIAMQEEKTR